MGDIYLIRHGETKWNKEKIFRGRADIPLNTRGKEQARAVGRALSEIGLKAVYTSRLIRARETAEEIARPQGLTPLIEEGLIDIDYGDWEGVSHEEVKEKFERLYDEWKSAPHHVVFPGGEGLGDVRKRASDTIITLAKRHKDETIALVSHRVPNKILLLSVLGLDDFRFWDIEQDAACINLIRYRDGHFIIAKVNDTSPIRPISEGMELDF